MNSSPESGSHHNKALQENLEILETIPFFNGFPSQALVLVSLLLERGVYAAGDLVVEEGEDNGQALYLLSGSLAVLAGTGEEPLFTVGAGQFVGGLSLLGPLPSLFALKAVQKTEVLLLSREQFQTVLEQYPHLFVKLLPKMLHLIRSWERAHLVARDGEPQSYFGVTLL